MAKRNGIEWDGPENDQTAVVNGKTFRVRYARKDAEWHLFVNGVYKLSKSKAADARAAAESIVNG